MNVAIYARVSTKPKNGSNGEQTGQNTETQLIALRQYCQQRGWSVAEEYVDNGVSGTKDSRPALNRLMADGKRRRFDAVIVWKLDRFGRSVRHLVNSLAEFKALGVGFVSMTDSLDTTTPQGELMFHIISAMAQFERSLIVERVKAGMVRAKQKGHKPGRVPMCIDLTAVRTRIAAGESMRTVAKALGISPALLSKRLSA